MKRNHSFILAAAITILSLTGGLGVRAALAATTLNVTADQSFTAQKVIPGTTQVPLGRFIFTPWSEPVTFSQWVINIASTGGGSGKLSNFRIYDEHNKLVYGTINPTASGNSVVLGVPIYASGPITIFSTRTFTIKADLSTEWKSGEIISLYFTPANAVAGVRGDTTGSNIIASPASLVMGPVVTVSSGGDAPYIMSIEPGVHAVIGQARDIAKIRFDATQSTVTSTVKEIQLEVRLPGMSDLNATRLISDLNIRNSDDTFRQVVSSYTPVSAGVYNVRFSIRNNNQVISPGTFLELLLEAKIDYRVPEASAIFMRLYKGAPEEPNMYSHDKSITDYEIEQFPERGAVYGSTVLFPAVLVLKPLGLDPMTVEIQKTGNPSKSELVEIAKIVITGGRIGEISHRAEIIQFIVDIPGVPEFMARQELKGMIIIDEKGDAIVAPPGAITTLGGGRYLFRAPLSFFNSERITEAQHRMVMSIRYQPTYLAPGQIMRIHLLNGVGVLPGVITFVDLFGDDDYLRAGYKLSYPLTVADNISVVAGEQFTATKAAITQRYGPVVRDNDKLSFANLKRLKDFFDAMSGFSIAGKDIILFPTDFDEVRVRGYVSEATAMGVWIRERVGEEVMFSTVAIHEFHHQMSALFSDCAKSLSTCSYVGSDLGNQLARFVPRMSAMISRSGAVAENYLRYSLTSTVINTDGSISALTADKGSWVIVTNKSITRGAVYKTQPYITFTSGPLFDQSFEVADYEDGIITISDYAPIEPLVDNTFNLQGGGADFFINHSQEFFAGLSNEWVLDSESAWSRCVAAYEQGNPTLMDQCLLFADVYAIGRNETSWFKLNADGSLSIQRIEVEKDEKGRVNRILGKSQIKFCIDDMGLVQIPRPGDVNCDGKIIASDALRALQISVGAYAATDAEEIASNVNCDGKITASDALIILRAAVGQITLNGCYNTTSTTVGDVAFTASGVGKATAAFVNDKTIVYGADENTRAIYTSSDGTCNGTATCTLDLSSGNTVTLTAQFSNAQTTVGGDGSTGTFGDGNTDTGSGTNGDTTEPPPPPIVSSNVDLTTAEKNELRTAPNKLYANKALNVIARFTNQGSEASTLVSRISLRIDQGNDGIWDFGTAESLPTMKPKQTKAIKFKKTYEPPQAGTYRYQVCINDDAMAIGYDIPLPIPTFTPGQDESDFSNNCSENTFTVLPPKTRKGGGAGGILMATGGLMAALAFARLRNRVSLMTYER